MNTLQLFRAAEFDGTSYFRYPVNSRDLYLRHRERLVSRHVAPLGRSGPPIGSNSAFGVGALILKIST